MTGKKQGCRLQQLAVTVADGRVPAQQRGAAAQIAPGDHRCYHHRFGPGNGGRDGDGPLESIITTPGPEFSKEEKFTLCSRIKKGGFIDDFTHDGDIGGGQYLNACVWFETLTGKSCIGNAFRPKYTYNEKEITLSEEKIRILQNAAHEAVKEHLNKIKPML